MRAGVFTSMIAQEKGERGILMRGIDVVPHVIDRTKSIIFLFFHPWPSIHPTRSTSSLGSFTQLVSTDLPLPLPDSSLLPSHWPGRRKDVVSHRSYDIGHTWPIDLGIAVRNEIDEKVLKPGGPPHPG